MLLIQYRPTVFYCFNGYLKLNVLLNFKKAVNEKGKEEEIDLFFYLT